MLGRGMEGIKPSIPPLSCLLKNIPCFYSRFIFKKKHALIAKTDNDLNKGVWLKIFIFFFYDCKITKPFLRI